jgi:hypothetical protein
MSTYFRTGQYLKKRHLAVPFEKEPGRLQGGDVYRL